MAGECRMPKLYPGRSPPTRGLNWHVLPNFLPHARVQHLTAVGSSEGCSLLRAATSPERPASLGPGQPEQRRAMWACHLQGPEVVPVGGSPALAVTQTH